MSHLKTVPDEIVSFWRAKYGDQLRELVMSHSSAPDFVVLDSFIYHSEYANQPVRAHEMLMYGYSDGTRWYIPPSFEGEFADEAMMLRLVRLKAFL